MRFGHLLKTQKNSAVAHLYADHRQQVCKYVIQFLPDHGKNPLRIKIDALDQTRLFE